MFEIEQLLKELQHDFVQQQQTEQELQIEKREVNALLGSMDDDMALVVPYTGIAQGDIDHSLEHQSRATKSFANNITVS
uniref:Uncharacterized protein n=1 Tax=Amphimedon queenslandica TaxID=400682 RepID=A0A1X7VB89_AMPQE